MRSLTLANVKPLLVLSLGVFLLLFGSGCAGQKCTWHSILRTDSGVLLARRPTSQVSVDGGETWKSTEASDCTQLLGSGEDVLCVVYKSGTLELWQAAPPYRRWERLTLQSMPHSAKVFRDEAVLTGSANREGFLMWKVKDVLKGKDSPRYVWNESVDDDDWSLENEPAAFSQPHGRSLQTPWRLSARENELIPLAHSEGHCFAVAKRGVFGSHCDRKWERLGSFPSNGNPAHYFVADKQLFIVSSSPSQAYRYAIGEEPARVVLPSGTRRLWLYNGELWAVAPGGLFRDRTKRGSWTQVLKPESCTRQERRGYCGFMREREAPPEMSWGEICAIDPIPCRGRR